MDAEADKPAIIFLCVVLSRLAYFTSNHFLDLYINIIGTIIPLDQLTIINNEGSFNNLVKDPQEFYDTSSDNAGGKMFGKKVKDVTSEINNKIKASVNLSPKKYNFVQPIMSGNVEKIGDFKVAYISIATAKYSGCYILVDTRMINCIFVIFRGTYSKESANSYVRTSTLTPKDGKLKGMDDLISDIYNSIIESMLYLEKTYLTRKKKIKVFTTGHSLGGGLATLFANRWNDSRKKYKSEEVPDAKLKRIYGKFDRRIYCIVLGTPKVFDKTLAKEFCDSIINNNNVEQNDNGPSNEEKNIIYIRLRTRGDPVPTYPLLYYSHPCIDVSNSLTTVVSKSPRSTTSAFGPGTYKSLKWNYGSKRDQFMNPFSHGSYYYINFINAVNIQNFMLSAVPSRKIAGEICNRGAPCSSFPKTNFKGVGDATIRFLLAECKYNGKYGTYNTSFNHNFIYYPKEKESSNKKLNIQTTSKNQLLDEYITKEKFSEIMGNMKEILTPSGEIVDLNSIAPLDEAEYYTIKVVNDTNDENKGGGTRKKQGAGTRKKQRVKRRKNQRVKTRGKSMGKKTKKNARRR